MVDQFLAGARPEDVAVNAHNLPALNRLATETRANNAALMRDYDLRDAAEQARLRAGKTYAGGNINNATRNELFKLHPNAGWSPEETAAIDRAITGGPADNLLRMIGRGLAPSHGGMNSTNTMGTAPAWARLLGLPWATRQRASCWASCRLRSARGPNGPRMRSQTAGFATSATCRRSGRRSSRTGRSPMAVLRL
jgi:hypothetical protein